MIERVLIAMVAKYVCGKLVVQRLLVAVVAKVINEISDYLVINRCWLRSCKASKVRLQRLQDKYVKFWNGCKVCMWEISCTKVFSCSGCKRCQ